ncbi:unnamed protein product, partial [Symbiodinium necroappetens]
MVDETLARYACWISSQAALASGMDQKLTALSRRTAAEFRKAEAEHADLATRIGLLEACCCRAGLMSSEVDVSFSKPVAGDEAPGRHIAEPLEQQCRGLVEDMLGRELRNLEHIAKRHSEMEADMERICQDFQNKLGASCCQE